MRISEADELAIDDAMSVWRQGDFTLEDGLELVHLADLSRPHSEASERLAEETGIQYGSGVGHEPAVVRESVPGLAMLSQDCDIVRSCRDKPCVEMAPVMPADDSQIKEARCLKSPVRAYLPELAKEGFVVDLLRSTLVEKGLAARWTHRNGCNYPYERRAFAKAVGKKFTRFGFPDSFQAVSHAMVDRLKRKHNRLTAEGAHLRALREVRVKAAPSWEDQEAVLTWLFVVKGNPEGHEEEWARFMEEWLARFDWTGPFERGGHDAFLLSELSAERYLEAEELDLEYLSVPKKA